MTARILIADDHALVRRGLRALIEGDTNFTIVGQANDSGEAMRLAQELRPDILLLDISMPGIGGIEVARQLHVVQPALRILILTAHEDESLLREAFKAGVMGYIVKRTVDAELIRALQTVARGAQYIHPSMTGALLQILAPSARSTPRDSIDAETLTPRELEVLRLLVHGYTNRQVAENLSISVRTAEGHRANLMGKLGLSSRLELVEYAKAHSLL